MTDPEPVSGAKSAKAFTAFLLEEARSKPALAAEYELPSPLVEEAMAFFMGAAPADNGDSEPRTVEYREPRYWFEHARLTSDLMRGFARRHGKNATLYAQLGRLHDADYLDHPHNVGAKNTDIHPYPLARFLSDRRAPPLACLVIMEHAGYIGRGEAFSCPMSAALSACDDLATFISVSFSGDAAGERRGNYGARLSDEAGELAASVAPPRFLIDADTGCPMRILARPEHFINDALKRAIEGTFAFSV